MKKNSNKGPGMPTSITVYVFLSLFAVSSLLLIFSGRNFVLDMKDAGLSLFSGIRGGIHGLSSFVSRTALAVTELTVLRREHAELLALLERFQELERTSAEIYLENIRLREQLDFAQTLRFHRIPAQISGRDPSNLFSAIVINRGSIAGVSNNMPVVAWQNGVQALVGKVIHTGLLESLVMPVFDMNAHVASRLSISRFEGITEGQGSPGAPLLMRFVPRRARDEVNIGDIVITSGMGGIFPADINIGRVSMVNVPRYETTLEIEIMPMIDFSRLEYVFVLGAANPQSEGVTSVGVWGND